MIASPRIIRLWLHGDFVATFEDGSEKSFPLGLGDGFGLPDADFALLFMTEEEVLDFYYRPIHSEQEKLIRTMLTRRVIGTYDGPVDTFDLPIWNDEEREEAFRELVKRRCVEALPAMRRRFFEEIFWQVNSDRPWKKETYIRSQYAAALIEIGGEQQVDEAMRSLIVPLLVEARRYNDQTGARRETKRHLADLASCIVEEYGKVGSWYTKKRWWEFWKADVSL